MLRDLFCEATGFFRWLDPGPVVPTTPFQQQQLGAGMLHQGTPGAHTVDTTL